MLDKLDLPKRPSGSLVGYPWRSASRFGPALGVAAALIVGLGLRCLVLGHVTDDATKFLLPWYRFALEHGIGGLRDAFTNYTPLYSYLLLIAARFDGLAPPLSLIKAISIAFELGCAAVAAELVWRITGSPRRTVVAFASVWLAPTVILNGASWAQADAIWTFFTLLSVSLFVRRHNGIVPFAVAFAVKAQAIFLGPFALGMLLRHRLSLAWLLGLPTVYLVLAVPALVAGRPLISVLRVYLDQADTFHNLNMNAGNVWVFANALPYDVGVAIGFSLAGVAGVALAIFIARSERSGPAFLLLVACCSLFLMPYLLPKMHDRYFYSFELAAICLACVEPRTLPVAVIAQVDGVLSYLAYDPGITGGVLPAAIGNTILGVFLVLILRRDVTGSRFPTKAWLFFAGAVPGLAVCLAATGTTWSLLRPLAMGLEAASMAILLRASWAGPPEQLDTTSSTANALNNAI